MQQVTEIAGIDRPHEKGIQSRMVMRRRSTIMLILVTLFGCNHHTNGEASSGTSVNGADVRELRRGLPGEPRTLDPQLADDDYSFPVVRDLYEGLTAEDETGKIVPGVANSWTVDETGTIYTFTLRPEAKWSNGDRIVANEFVSGLQRAVDPRTASGSAALLAVIKGATDIIAGHKQISELGVTAIGATTIRIELEHAAPYILQILSQPIAAPDHNTANPQVSLAQPVKPATVYNGAYVLTRRAVGSFIQLTRNPNYWNAAHVSIGKVRYVIAESGDTELSEYMSGELDMTFTIPLPDIKRISERYDGQVQMAPILGTCYLALNLSQGPLKENVSLRQALSMAIDREEISEHVMLGTSPAYAFVAAATSNYDPPRYEWATWDRQRKLSFARSLMVAAGYSEKKPLHLRLYFNSGEGIQRIMVAVAAGWKQNLGVVSELTSDEFRVFLAGRRDRSRWDVARLGWDADYDDPSSFLEIFTHDNNHNDPGFESEAFNSLVAQAQREPRSDLRAILLQKAEKTLLDEYPIIPIYFSRGRRLVKPYVGGAQMNPMNRTYSKNLYWKGR